MNEITVYTKSGDYYYIDIDKAYRRTYDKNKKAYIFTPVESTIELLTFQTLFKLNLIDGEWDLYKSIYIPYDSISHVEEHIQ